MAFILNARQLQNGHSTFMFSTLQLFSVDSSEEQHKEVSLTTLPFELYKNQKKINKKLFWGIHLNPYKKKIYFIIFNSLY